MTLTSRDRKILMLLVPVALAAAYWMLLLSPKHKEQASLKSQLTSAQGERSTAAQRLAGLTTAKRSFADDYATVLKLGKSIPDSLDMPSLLVQLDAAAAGTGISFTQVQAGQRSSAPGTKPGAGSGSSAPAGGQGATSGSASSGVAGLDSIPLTLEFDGDFFRLADFFHQLKRFVNVANGRLQVSGRLIAINKLNFVSQAYPTIQASVSATVYLAPKAQGITAGATPSGPATASTPASAAPAGGGSSPSSAPAAAAVVAR